jgi:hypothetical protein
MTRTCAGCGDCIPNSLKEPSRLSTGRRARKRPHLRRPGRVHRHLSRGAQHRESEAERTTRPWSGSITAAGPTSSGRTWTPYGNWQPRILREALHTGACGSPGPARRAQTPVPAVPGSAFPRGVFASPFLGTKEARAPPSSRMAVQSTCVPGGTVLGRCDISWRRMRLITWDFHQDFLTGRS